MMLKDCSDPVGRWFDPVTSEEISHAKLLKRLASQQVVLLGEKHDQADMHRWQLHVAAGLLAHRADLVMGFEMFPVKVQPVLDAWVSGVLTENQFLEEVDWKTIWEFPAAVPVLSSVSHPDEGLELPPFSGQRGRKTGLGCRSGKRSRRPDTSQTCKQRLSTVSFQEHRWCDGTSESIQP